MLQDIIPITHSYYTVHKLCAKSTKSLHCQQYCDRLTVSASIILIFFKSLGLSTMWSSQGNFWPAWAFSPSLSSLVLLLQAYQQVIKAKMPVPSQGPVIKYLLGRTGGNMDGPWKIPTIWVGSRICSRISYPGPWVIKYLYLNHCTLILLILNTIVEILVSLNDINA